MSINGVPVSPFKSVRNLVIDCDLVMRTHVLRTVSGSFAALRQLRQFHKSVLTATFQSLLVTLVISRLDYGNGVLIGLTTHLVHRLQLALVARPGARRLPDCCTDVQGAAWDRTGVSRTCCPCGRSAWSTVTSLCWH